MSDIEEQNDPLLESNPPTHRSKSSFTWKRLSHFARRIRIFIWYYLIQICKFFRKNADDTRQPRRKPTFPARRKLIFAVRRKSMFATRRKPISAARQTVHIGTQTCTINDIGLEQPIHASSHSILVSQTEEEINHNEQSGGGVQTIETRPESVEPVNGPDLQPACIAASVDINASIGCPTVSPSTPTGLITTTAPLSTPVSVSSRSPFVTRNPMKIALSYSGEKQDRVEPISQLLHDGIATMDCPFPVFYAPKFQDEVVGLDGMKILLSIYRQASLVVVFLSPAYHQTDFCEEEWRTIKERFLHDKERKQNRERLFLVKLGDFNAKELNLVADDFYIDGMKMNDKEVADQIISRWHKVEQLPVQEQC